MRENCRRRGREKFGLFPGTSMKMANYDGRKLTMPHITKSSRKRGGAQAERFREKARELECDEDEAAFEETLKQVAKARPKLKDAKDKAPDD